MFKLKQVITYLLVSAFFWKENNLENALTKSKKKLYGGFIKHQTITKLFLFDNLFLVIFYSLLSFSHIFCLQMNSRRLDVKLTKCDHSIASSS